MKASTQACQWNPKTFPKISQPWQSNWLSISSNPPHQQPKLWEFGCEIIFIWSSQRSRIIKAKNTRWEQSKPCLNTKEFVQAKLQTHRRWLGKSKDPSASQPPKVQNCGLECLHECWVISGMLFTSSYKERNSLCPQAGCGFAAGVESLQKDGIAWQQWCSSTSQLLTCQTCLAQK